MLCFHQPINLSFCRLSQLNSEQLILSALQILLHFLSEIFVDRYLSRDCLLFDFSLTNHRSSLLLFDGSCVLHYLHQQPQLSCLSGLLLKGVSSQPAVPISAAKVDFQHAFFFFVSTRLLFFYQLLLSCLFGKSSQSEEEEECMKLSFFFLRRVCVKKVTVWRDI